MLLPTRSRSASRPVGVPRTRTRTSSSVGSVPEDVELWMEEQGALLSHRDVDERPPAAADQDELCSGEWAARAIHQRRSERASSSESFSGVL